MLTTFKSDTSLHRIIKLDIPNEEYYVTTFRPGDETSVQEILSIDSVNHNLIKVQKPYTPHIMYSRVKTSHL
jgi:hypothetical protein